MNSFTEQQKMKEPGEKQPMIVNKKVEQAIQPVSPSNLLSIKQQKRESEKVMPIVLDILDNPFEQQQIVEDEISIEESMKSSPSISSQSVTNITNIKKNQNGVKIEQVIVANRVPMQNKNDERYLQVKKENEKLYILLERLQQRLTNVQKSNQILKEENEKIKILYNNLHHQYKVQYTKLEQRLKQNQIDSKHLSQNLLTFKYQNLRMISQIGQKCEVQQNKMMRFIDIVEKWQKQEQNEESIGDLRLDTKIEKKEKRSKSRFLSSILNSQKIQDLKLPLVILKPVPIDHLAVTATTYYMIDITQRQTNLTYVGETGTWTHLLGNYLIDPNNIIQFVYKIKKSASNAISIGIIDRKYGKLRSCGKKETNCIFYYGGSGRLWESGIKLQKMGLGFKQGDTVVMVVLLAEGAIRWYINGRLQAQYNSVISFKEGRFQEVEWVPFVNMCTAEDTIIWQVGN